MANPATKNTDRFMLLAFLLLKLVLSYVLVNSVYELHRDEYLHLDQGRHLAAGFTSVPPLTSLFSWLIRALGNNVFMVRLFPALFGMLTMAYCWKTIDILKGSLLAKCLVATALIFSSLLRLNTLYQPNSFDVLAWTAAFYYLLRYFNGNQPKYLYFFAMAIALGFLNKYNILFLAMGLLPAMIITPGRRVFADRHFYFALLLGLAMVLPNLVWQVSHQFPVLRHMQELQRTQLVHVSRANFLVSQPLFFVSAIVVLLAGLGSLLLYKPFRPYRWVLLTYVFTMAVFTYFRAKDYYALGLYPILLAFGTAYLGHKLVKRYLLTVALFVFMVGSFVYLLPLMMPFYAPQQIVAHHKRFERVGALRWEDGKSHQLPQDYADMQGWRELAQLADSAYALAKDKDGLLVRADNYGQAGAINYYSKYKNINAVAYNADYLYWFKLDRPIKTMIMVTGYRDNDPQRTREKPYFAKITKIGEIRNPYAREQGAGVFLLEGATAEVTTIIKREIEEEKQ